jgi:hypothetical protein
VNYLSVQNTGQARYEETKGTRTYRKRTLGTVVRYPHLWDAEKTADALRNTINAEFIVPDGR